MQSYIDDLIFFCYRHGDMNVTMEFAGRMADAEGRFWKKILEGFGMKPKTGNFKPQLKYKRPSEAFQHE